MKYAIALLIIYLPSVAYALDHITLIPFNADPFMDVKTYRAPFKHVYFDELDIGDSLSNAAIVLHGEHTQAYRVALQLETSLSINDEGAHLDLTDWKHCTTEWQSLKTDKGYAFALPDFEVVDVDCFPVLSHEEIKAEVLKQGGEDWVSILEEQGWPAGYSPIDVSLSTVRIKIEKLVDTQWILVTVIHMTIPMGC